MQCGRGICAVGALCALTSLVFSISLILPDMGGGLSGGEVNRYCAKTPMAWIPSPCGCPTSVLQDFCEDAVPPNGTNTITGYMGCWPSTGECFGGQVGCGRIMLCRNEGQGLPFCNGGNIVPAYCSPAQKYPPDCTSTRYHCW